MRAAASPPHSMGLEPTDAVVTAVSTCFRAATEALYLEHIKKWKDVIG